MHEDYKEQWPGLDIKYLVLSTDDFIVFIDSDIDVDWKTNDKQVPKDSGALNDILNRAALLESMPSDHLQWRIRLHFKRMIGEAIARGLDHDYENGKLMLLLAENYVSDRNEEMARSWYLLSSGVTSGTFLIIGSIIWFFRDWTKPLLGELVFVLVLSSIAGSLGALLSVVMRMGKTSVNGLAGKYLHYIEGTFRVIAGIISALIASLAVYCGILAPIFIQVQKQHIAMILSGLIAGASERLVPTLIKRVNGESNTSK